MCPLRHCAPLVETRLLHRIRMTKNWSAICECYGSRFLNFGEHFLRLGKSLHLSMLMQWRLEMSMMCFTNAEHRRPTLSGHIHRMTRRSGFSRRRTRFAKFARSSCDRPMAIASLVLLILLLHIPYSNSSYSSLSSEELLLKE